MSVQTRPRPFDAPQTGEPVLAHIVAPSRSRGVDGSTLCLEARVLGLEVEALCGVRLRPSHNPDLVPNCQECDRLFTARFGPEGVPSSA